MQADTDTIVPYLQSYCAQYGHQCHLQARWFTWNELRRIMPLPEQNTQTFIQQKQYETQDSRYHYQLKIENRSPAGYPAPLEYCRPQLRDDILQHRRTKNLQEQLQEHYQQAVEKDIIEIY